MIDCKDCENEYECRLTQVCILEHDNELFVGRWHRYPDEKPEYGKYLITLNAELVKVEIAQYCNVINYGDSWVSDNGLIKYSDTFVKSWMELPKGYS